MQNPTIPLKRLIFYREKLKIDLVMLQFIRTFALFQDGSNLLRRATVIAQRVWAIFMSILYPRTAVSLRKINAFRGLSSWNSANDTAFCVCKR